MIQILSNSEMWWRDIRDLRNDDRVKSGFIQQNHIEWEAHEKYMKMYGDNYLVATYEGKFAGYVGSIDGDIRICVKPEFQGKGVAVCLVEGIMRKFPNSYAKVKIENEPSKKLFDKCGFKVKYVIMEKNNGETQSV